MNCIKNYRKIRKISIYKLAELTDLTPSYISNLENGHRVNPTKVVMEKISKALSETVQVIFFPSNKEG